MTHKKQKASNTHSMAVGKQPSPKQTSPMLMFADQAFVTLAPIKLTTTYKSKHITIKRGKYMLHF